MAESGDTQDGDDVTDVEESEDTQTGDDAGDTSEDVADTDAGESGDLVDPACDSISETATVQAHLRITADNECEVFVNGTSVGTSEHWAAAVTIDVSLYVHPGKKNVVAVVGRNTSSQEGNDRGIIGELTIDAGSEDPTTIVLTNASWKASVFEVPGWQELSFDDSSWVAATEVAEHGDLPWSNVLTVSDAKWIWTGPVPFATADKPNLESAYVRHTFYFDVTGTGTTGEPGCPEL